MKLFDEMSPVAKLEHIEHCLETAKPHAIEATNLADVVDVWDYWAPYLTTRLRKLEQLRTQAKLCRSYFYEDPNRAYEILRDALNEMEA